jgi:hypothetical protein
MKINERIFEYIQHKKIFDLDNNIMIFSGFVFLFYTLSPQKRSRCDVGQFFLQQLFRFSSTIQE